MTAELGQPGQIIDGKYRIVRLLGTGGMGAVYEGENVRIRRKVAIKMLHASVSSQDEVLRRFENEAKAAGMVGSDHICEVLDMGELGDGTRYMVMEYLDGETLSSLIKRSVRLRAPQSIPILVQILDALGAAHVAGIIHRDLKPDNVFILPQKGGIQNFVKILDFGVSKFSQLSGEAMNVTRAGAVVGTPYYMSPEQARGTSAIDQRTDIYAIGVLLYQATTGQVPYQAETFNELLFKIVLEVAPPPQTYVPDLDPDFAAIIQRAMAREPEQRYTSCAEFKDALLRYQASRVNPLPPYNLPTFPNDGPPQARTEVLDLSRLPPGTLPGGSMPSWPGLPPAGDGTMPMQPGIGSLTGSGSMASPMQSGASWANASNPGVAPPTSTSNSWGNASSPANVVVKPRTGNGLLVAVVAAASLIGIGVAVFAFVMMGRANANAARPTTATTATVTATATSSASSAAATAPSTSATTAAATSATTAPTATVAAVDSAKPAAASAKPLVAPAQTGHAVGPKAVPTVTPKKGSGSKGGGSDLGY
jgi:serine/threonine-protein kinase